MNKKEINALLKWALDAKAVMEKSGEEYFGELKRREKQEIMRAMIDIDLDIGYKIVRAKYGSYLIFNYDCDVTVYFTTYIGCTDINEIVDSISDMIIEGCSDGYQTEIENIDDLIAYLQQAKSSELPLALLNTSILTTAGDYRLSDISLSDAAKMVAAAESLDSAIGHQSTAEIMTTLLGVDVPLNRQMFAQQVGQQALVFKLNGRPEEGKVLSKADIEQIGYKFQLLTRSV